MDDLVIVRQTKEYKTGDIVVYQGESSLVIHRVLSIDGEEVVTKGDANNKADDPVAISVIKGKMVAHIPFVGKIVRLLKTPVVLVLLVAAAILLFELPYLQKRKQEEMDKEKIKEEIRKLKNESL